MQATEIIEKSEAALNRFAELERNGFDGITTPDMALLALAFQNVADAKTAEALQVPGQTGQIGRRVDELWALLDRIGRGGSEEDEDE